MSIRRMAIRSLQVCILALMVGAAAAQSGVDEKLDERLALAEQVAAVTIPIILEDVEARALATAPAGPERDVFQEFLKEVVVVEELAEVLVPAVARHFTAEEIGALLEFYDSPVGTSILKKYGAYTAEVQPAISALVLKAVRRAQEALGTNEQ